MPDINDIPSGFRRFAVGVMVVSALTAVVAALAEQPPWMVAVLVAVVSGLAPDLDLKFPSRITISPLLIVKLAFVAVTFRWHGGIALAALAGGCGGISYQAVRSRRWLVLGFNVGQLALCLISAASVLRLAANNGLWLAYPLAALVYTAANYGFVLVGGSLRSGRPLRDTWADIRGAAVSYSAFAVLGLLAGSLYRTIGPVTVPLLIVPLIIARTVLTSIVRFRQAYNQMELLYGFTGRLELLRAGTDTTPAILEELCGMLNMAVCEVTLATADGWRRTTRTAGSDRAVSDAGSAGAAQLAAVADGPILGADLAAGDAVDADLRRRSLQGTMLAPLRVENRLVGAILVADPTDDRRPGVDDLKLFETLANHAAVTLDHSRLVEQLRYDSRHDGLTGLPNRTRFTELLADLTAPCAVLLIDLDRFKEVNDTLGHDRGDVLLLGVGRRITEELGHKGIVARLGGDEFAVLLPATGKGDAAQAAVALLAALEQPVATGGLELEITASIGVAVAVSDADQPTKLLQQADVAMYQAKGAHSGWELYDPARDQSSPLRLTLAGELRRAIDNREMEVWYQPKVDLPSCRVSGVEALVRWRHPHHGLLPPDQFVPIAEHAGLIRPLTLFVLDAAVRQWGVLRALGYELEMSVNLSVRSMLDVYLPDQVAEVLTTHGMPPAQLTLEITESSLIADPGRTIGILDRLAGLGASISVDDFGTGYSSLAYLNRLPANEVKIDRSFVAGMLRDTGDQAIVHSTIELAHNLGLRAVAEGVEDAATLERLTQASCDQVQGFHISPALAPGVLAEWLLSTHPALGR